MSALATLGTSSHVPEYAVVSGVLFMVLPPTRRSRKRPRDTRVERPSCLPSCWHRTIVSRAWKRAGWVGLAAVGALKEGVTREGTRTQREKCAPDDPPSFLPASFSLFALHALHFALIAFSYASLWHPLATFARFPQDTEKKKMTALLKFEPADRIVINLSSQESARTVIHVQNTST